MFINNILFKKAAFFFAAFFIFKNSVMGLGTEFKDVETLRKKAQSFLTQKKKKEALDLFSEYLKNETDKSKKAEVTDLLERTAKTFLSKEAQEAYEASLNLTLENLKEAKKLNETCLQLEPENIDCLVQKIKILTLEKNKSEALKYFKQDFLLFSGTNVFSWVEAYLNKENNPHLFKSKSYLKKFNEKPIEDVLVATILEIERSFAVKNFSRAKEGIEYLEKNYSDYPDIEFFKQKIELESSEEFVQNQHEPNPLYLTKCKNLSKSLSRKYRYDFYLCQRSR